MFVSLNRFVEASGVVMRVAKFVVGFGRVWAQLQRALFEKPIDDISSWWRRARNPAGVLYPIVRRGRLPKAGCQTLEARMLHQVFQLNWTRIEGGPESEALTHNQANTKVVLD